MKWNVWDGILHLLLVIVKDVGVSDTMEDGVFETIGGLAGEREDVRSVLEEVNADALWLVEEKARRKDGGEKPVKPEGIKGWEFADVDV